MIYTVFYKNQCFPAELSIIIFYEDLRLMVFLTWSNFVEW